MEILKTLYRGANILIMDEPTAVLAPQEIDELMKTMRSMIEQGKSIIFISHKLHEVTAVADRLTVLRKGVATAEGIDIEGMTGEKLAELMVGRNVIFTVEKKPQKPGDVVLEVREVSVRRTIKVSRLCKNLSLDVRRARFWALLG